MNHPSVTDDVIDFTRALIDDSNLKIADKEKGVFKILPQYC